MVPPTVAWVGSFLDSRVAPARGRVPLLTPVGRGMLGRAGTARGGTANHRIAPPTVWVNPIGRLLQAGTAPHASSRQPNGEAPSTADGVSRPAGGRGWSPSPTGVSRLRRSRRSAQQH